jgi:hypothetical protein
VLPGRTSGVESQRSGRAGVSGAAGPAADPRGLRPALGLGGGPAATPSGRAGDPCGKPAAARGVVSPEGRRRRPSGHVALGRLRICRGRIPQHRKEGRLDVDPLRQLPDCLWAPGHPFPYDPQAPHGWEAPLWIVACFGMLSLIVGVLSLGAGAPRWLTWVAASPRSGACSFAWCPRSSSSSPRSEPPPPLRLIGSLGRVLGPGPPNRFAVTITWFRACGATRRPCGPRAASGHRGGLLGRYSPSISPGVISTSKGAWRST